MIGGALPPDHVRRCTATSSRTGERCRRAAIVGGTVCASHGGRAPQVRAAARRRIEREKLDGDLADLLAEFEAEAAGMDAVEVLREQLSVARSMAHVLRLIVGQLQVPSSERLLAPEVWQTATLFGLDHLGDGTPHVAVEMLGQWTDRAAKLSELAIRAGLEERQVEITAELGRQMVEILRAAHAVTFAAVRAALSAGELTRDRLDVLEASEVPVAVAAEVNRIRGERAALGEAR